MAQLDVRIAEKADAWTLLLRGELTGERGGDPGHAGLFTVTAIVVRVAARDVLTATLPVPGVGLPAWLLDRVTDTLRPAAEIIAEQHQALRREAFRRLKAQEIDWSGGAFLGLPGIAAAAAVRGEARLDLSQLLHPPQADGDAPLAAFSVRVAAAVTMTDPGTGATVSVSHTYAIAVVFRPDAVPSLRIDLDEFDLSLPEASFPALDLSGPAALPLAANVTATAGILHRLTGDATVTVTCTDPADGNAHLLLRVDGGRLFWAVVAGAGAGAGAGELDTVPLAIFEATISTSPQDPHRPPPVLATVTGITLKHTAAGFAWTARIEPQIPEITLGSGSRRFGPLLVRWENATLKPEARITVAGAGVATLRGRLAFDRLVLSAADDPEATVAVAGTVLVTRAGVEVVELRLVEPYPVEHVLWTIDAIADGAARVLRLLADLAPQPGGPPDLSGLLDVLARIAVAVARAVVFVAGAAGELAGKALAGIAEAVEALVRAIAALVRQTDRHLTVEVRIGTDPLELRQILVTVRGSAPVNGPTTLSAAGFGLTVDPGWQPGLLIDLVAAPGAYIVVGREGAAAGPLATLTTDLWFKRPSDGRVQAVRDADPDTGNRASKPLLSITTRLKNARPAEMLILAGVSRGRGVFLQRVGITTGTTPVAGVVTVTGPFAHAPLGGDSLDVGVAFEKDRVLPLLGMGEPDGGAAAGCFLDRLRQSLSQLVWIKESEPGDVRLDGSTLRGNLRLGVRVAGLETELALRLALDLGSFEATVEGGDRLPIQSGRIEERALGLLWVVEQIEEPARTANTPVSMFLIDFDGAETTLSLNRSVARMELRFTGLSSDGRGVGLEVEDFRVGRGGLDLRATVKDDPVRMNGLDVPFRFTGGGLTIRGSRITEAAIAGRGTLPPALTGDAGCHVALTFQQDGSGALVLQSGAVELDKLNEPIVCHGTRFTLTISAIEIAFVPENGYHFYFLVTGSLQFTPNPGEFAGGLLQHFKNVRMTLEKVPLTGDPRVLARHISFQVPLNPKQRFPLFNLFTFELRGIGFHPASPKFGGAPAMNVSGQIAFADIGDVMQPKIDFHGLWIAPPEAGQALPRIRADGLGVDIGLSGTARIRGSVLAVDEKTTIEGAELAPPGFNAYGFLGEGELTLEGWGTMPAAMGFLELEREDAPGERRKSFFLYLDKPKVAYEIPTPVWTFWLREVGFGFGFRYTLKGIKQAERAGSTAELIATLDEVSKRQGDLARFSAWRPDPEGDHVTLALRGAFQTYPAEKVWNEKREEEAENPFLFDVVAALRSDMTFLMSARGWLATNYKDFLEDRGGLRTKPGFRGYLFISAPRAELLARVVGDRRGYIGTRLDLPAEVRQALRSSDWSATLYIRPGLLHYELGWPDQLAVRLKDDPRLRITVRGGMIFRAAEEGLLWGYNVAAEAFLSFEGRAGGDSLGLEVRGSLDARFTARLLCYLSWRLKGSLLYGLVSLDANLSFSVRAWMEINLLFRSFTLQIPFSFTVQFTAAVELAVTPEGVGARVEARIAVPVFGCTLSVGLGFALNDGRLREARARVDRFLAMGLTAETPTPAGMLATRRGDERIDRIADLAGTPAAPVAGADPPPPPPVDHPPISRAGLGRPIGPTRFWLVLHRAEAFPADLPDEARAGLGIVRPADCAYALLVPREPGENGDAGFYASPQDPEGWWHRLVLAPDPVDDGPSGKVLRWRAEVGRFETLGADEVAKVRGDAPLNASSPDGSPAGLALADAMGECFLYDAQWHGDRYRILTWREPPRRRHGSAKAAQGASQDERRSNRDLAQRARAALAVRDGPVVEGVHHARATMMGRFIEQFVTLARTGRRADAAHADVTDLGLVFFGPIGTLEKLHGRLGVAKSDHGTAVRVELFNPSTGWFSEMDPEFAAARHEVHADGVKLDWNLETPGMRDVAGADDPRGDPEHHLHHYEITRTVEGREDAAQTVIVKPAATVGGVAEDGITVTLLRPDWQFTDDLSDLDADARRALLPAPGDDAALEGATRWLEVFGDVAEVTLTYTITPVDVAGTRGLPFGRLIDIPRPQPPVRPAEAKLHIIVRRGTPRDSLDATRAWEREEEAPDNLAVVLAVRDRAWGAASAGDRPLPQGRASRRYRLVADPEDVVPSGSYGSDALTDRLRGAPSARPAPSGGEVVYEFARADFEGCRITEDLDLIEPVAAERDGFDWQRLAGSPGGGGAVRTLLKDAARDFLARLWRRPGGGRVATRFHLETLIVVTDAAGAERWRGMSRRVPVSVEVQIRSAGDAPRAPAAVLRPEAFEWPVVLALPPLAPGEVRATAGFAALHMPVPRITLEEVMAGKPAVRRVRDPQRRVLTTLEWDAAPRWSGPGEVRPLHRATIAGFDVHELDLATLAPSDLSADVPLALNRMAWERAARVARAQLLPASSAMLVPHSNEDRQNWTAHYPSESWRLEPGGNGTGHRPVRRPWWSARESTIAFPARLARLRLLPDIDETLIAQLLAGGRPNRISVRIDCTLATEEARMLFADPPRVTLAKLQIGTHTLSDLFDTADPDPDNPESVGFTRKGGATFGAAALRGLLLCLAWKPLPAVHRKVAEEPGVLAGLSLVVVSSVAKGQEAAGFTTVKATVPLDFGGALHPVLREAVAELALAADGNAGAERVHRRYTPLLQPTPPVEAKDLAGFLSATAAEKDPYGWGVLQALGLSVTVRLHDGDSDDFVPPHDLLRRLDEVMRGILERYADALGPAAAGCLGAPFAEILLRPGRDRSPLPFDAMAEADPQGFDAAADALAVVQLSLRPVPRAVWSYGRIVLRRKPGSGPPATTVTRERSVDDTGRPVIRTTTVRYGDPELSFDGIVAETELLPAGAGQPVRPRKGETRVAIPLPPEAEVTLFVRRPVTPDAPDGATAPATPALTLRRHEAIEERYADDGSPRGEPTHHREIQTIDLWGWFERGAGDARPHPVPRPGAAGPDTGADPFERFPPMAAAEWAGSFVNPWKSGAEQSPKAAFDTLRHLLRAVRPDLAWPVDERVSDLAGRYLDWSQRFLDHGPEPDPDPEPGTPLRVAFAAPRRQTPWRLAAQANGSVRLNILHDDGWSQTRAYAVRPVGRYQDLALAAGALDRAGNEALLPTVWRAGAEAPLPRPIGAAVVAVPRTEPIEPPTILGSRRSTAASGDAWELVVLRHGEESLAASNRMLMARLGFEGVYYAFVRSYRDPEWPVELAKLLPDRPQPLLHPPRAPAVAVDPARDPDATADGVLTEVATHVPAIVKGAEILRFDALPYYYRTTILAAARAGAVVSPVVAATREDFPVAIRKSDDRARLAVERRNGQARLLVTLPLIPHADLLDARTRAIWVDRPPGAERPDDVAWWPDPAIVYTLLRIRTRPDGSIVEEEDAELHLMPRGGGAGLITVRPRGPRFTGGANADPTVMTDSSKEKPRRFWLTVPLVMTEPKPPEGRALADAGTEDQRRRFNHDAQHVAVIVMPHALTLEVDPGTDAKAAIAALAAALQGTLAAIGNGSPAERPWLSLAFIDALMGIADRLQAASGAATDADALAIARLPETVMVYWREDAGWPGPALPAPARFGGVGGAAPPPARLTVFGLPTDGEMETLSTTPFGAAVRSLAWRFLAGGADRFRLRAVHPRAKGTAEGDVAPPAWADDVAEGVS